MKYERKEEIRMLVIVWFCVACMVLFMIGIK